MIGHLLFLFIVSTIVKLIFITERFILLININQFYIGYKFILINYQDYTKNLGLVSDKLLIRAIFLHTDKPNKYVSEFDYL